MIKRFKGFSLAELLITLGIIGIIASIGVSISKIGIERAYKLYYYTGYVGLSQAIGHAINNGKLPDTTFDECDFYEDMLSILSAEKMSDFDMFSHRFKTPNGIVYTIRPNIDNNDLDNIKGDFLIRMEVPHMRGVNNTDTCFKYQYNKDYDFIIPRKPSTSTAAKPTPSTAFGPSDEDDFCAGTISLQNRVDLLPFYVQTGTVGKLITPYNPSTQTFAPPNAANYQKKKFMTFEEAFCTINGSTANDFVDCPAITSTPITGLLRVASPQEVK